MKEYFKALANFQQEVPVIHKGTEGYGYSYADLKEIFIVINPLLKKHGLGFTQEMDGEDLKTTIFHVESGEFRESSTHIPQGVQLAKMNVFQVLGSGITYIRRYALSSALGLVTDKDIDGAGSQTKGETNKDSGIVPTKILNEVSTELESVTDIKSLESLGKSYKDEITKYPSIKAMFNNKHKALK